MRLLARFRAIAVLGLIVWLAPLPVAAAGLYTGTAPVNSQSDDDRAGALRAALGQVIVKLSGDPAVLARPEVAKALGRADRYMQQFSYQPNPNPGEAARLQLVAQFDGTRVDALLRDLNLDSAAVVSAPASGTDAATGTSAAGSYRLWISGLRSAEDYARLIGGLGANDQVRSLRVEQAHGTGVQVKVETRGALQSLLESLDATRLAHTTNTHPPLQGIDALLDFEP